MPGLYAGLPSACIVLLRRRLRSALHGEFTAGGDNHGRFTAAPRSELIHAIPIIGHMFKRGLMRASYMLVPPQRRWADHQCFASLLINTGLQREEPWVALRNLQASF